jgi:DNA-binding transcriptional MerR regulator
MPWSTSEVADLAGTTVNTVRHYHRIGLLEQPTRLSNGYKQYQVAHLVRLLQIRRLRDLGVPLDQIEQVGFGTDSPADALRAIDADLTSSIERLQRARAEVRAILDGASVTGVPAGFENVASRLTKPEQSLMLVYSQLYDDEAMSDLKQMLEADPDAMETEFVNLAPDADEPTRQRLAEHIGPGMAQLLVDYPWLLDQAPHSVKAVSVTQETVDETVRVTYNPAQLDVMARAGVIARALAEENHE